MILPDGYSEVPAGKIAAVVTHLEMTERPAPSPAPSGPWTLRHVERPDLAWYRDLYRRVGEEWLWFSRIRASAAKLVGSGAGRFLMHRALELSWSRPIKRLWLHTCTFDHPAALPFYQRAGF